jgi:uncharacterized protein YjiS (DUF1127 family)
MLTNFLFVTVGSIREWKRRHTERKAMWMATDGLSRLPGDVLDDIGISRDQITCAFHSRRNAKRAERRRSVKPMGEFGRL